MHKIFANTVFIGKQVISLPSCHSTNAIAAEMTANSSLKEGGLVITQNQTRGRGQRGNTWESAAGKNLTFSVVLMPVFLKASQQFELNRMTSLAVLDTLNRYLPTAKNYIKWPNDLICNRKKIAGILIENSISSRGISESIVGIGLNVNQKEALLDTANSFINESERSFDLEEVLSFLVSRLEHYYLIIRSGDFRYLHQHYHEKLYKRDQVAFYESADGKFNGIIRQVSAEGVLEIELEDGRKKDFQFKEVRLLA